MDTLIKRVLHFYKKCFAIIMIVSFMILSSLAWHNRFIFEDSFISFRYADNLVRGNGLVFNIGERDKGYAIKIKSSEHYANPIDPYVMIKSFKAPQSFMYLPDIDQLCAVQ